MLWSLTEIELAVAVAPFTAAVVARELWLRRRLRRDRRAREAEADRVRREAMRAMHDALAAEQAARRTRDEFLARMSHEMRTPLNAVIGFSRVLERKAAEPEHARLLGRVRAGGEQLLRLVEDVLDQSRIEDGRLQVSLDDVDVARAAARVALEYRDAAVAKGLRLLAVVPPTSAPIRLDAGRFDQVLRNLLENAVKFTARGDIKVTLVTDAATGRPSRLMVTDTGIGIPRDRVEGMFRPFEQAQGGRDRSYGGTGLGLPLARQLCEVMGLELFGESEVDRGSRFTIRFPRS